MRSEARFVPLRRVLNRWAVLTIVGVGISSPISPAAAQRGSRSAQIELPAATVCQLLEYGLNADGSRAIKNCEDSARALASHGVNQTDVDLALALVYARSKRFGDMRRLLDKTVVAAPQDVRVLRLHSWAQLSDRQYEEGLNTILALLKAVSDDDPAERQSQIHYAGSAFGFALVAIPAAKPELLGQIDDIHDAVLATVSPDSLPIFREAETSMRNNVSAEIASIMQAQADDSEQITAERQAATDRLRQQQQEIESEGQERQAQARRVRETAHASLTALAQEAAPYQRELARLQAEVNSLYAIRNSKVEDYEKEAYDPQIAAVETQISFVQANLAPLVAEYNRIEQNAIMALNALGSRYQQLGRVHHANKTRLRKNEPDNKAGLSARFKTQLRVQTRLAAHLALDFDAEKARVLGAREDEKR